MDLFSELPEVLISTVLVSWVPVRSFGLLDSAMCNKSTRANYLKLINGSNFVIVQQYEMGDVKNCYERADQFVAWILRRDVALARLIVTEVFVNQRSRLPYLKSHGKYVRSVRIENRALIVSSSDQIVEDLCVHCPGVQVLECYASLAPPALEAVASHWKQLTHLTMEMCNRDDEIGSVARYYRSSDVRYWPAYEWVDEFSEFLCCCSTELLVITTDVPFDQSDYETIASRCPLLRELNASSEDMEDTALAAIAEGCPFLSTLHVEDNDQITDAGIAAVARNQALQTLSLTGCWNITDAGLRSVVECCPLMERVQLDACRRFSDPTLIMVGQHCHNLRELSVDDTTITPEGLAAVAAGCPLLEKLSVRYSKMADSGTEAAVRALPRLRSFSMGPTEQSTLTVRALAECCPLLEEAGLYRCRDIGDEEITALARRCPALRQIDIMGTAVRRTGLCAIRDHCSKLEVIVLNEYAYDARVEERGFFPATVEVVCVLSYMKS
jgi:hypothetical protein